MSLESKIGAEIKLTIQIVNFRSRHDLRMCLFSIGENLPAGIETEILVINNDRETLDKIADEFEETLNLNIHELGENVGFGKAQNAGIQKSRGEYILFLNPDTIIFPGALDRMLNVLVKDQEVGMIGPLLVDEGDNIQPDCFGAHRTPLSTIKNKIFKKNNEKIFVKGEIFETDWISGGALLVRREALEKTGGFDEKYFMYFEDVDLCLRAKRKGLKIVVDPKARIFHKSGKSFETDQEKKKYYYASQDYYFRKHFGAVSASIVKLFRLPYYIKNVYLGR